MTSITNSPIMEKIMDTYAKQNWQTREVMILLLFICAFGFISVWEYGPRGFVPTYGSGP